MKDRKQTARWIVSACTVLAIVFLCGCSLTLQVDVFSNNNILATRCQTTSEGGSPEMMIEGGGTTDAQATIPLR